MRSCHSTYTSQSKKDHREATPQLSQEVDSQMEKYRFNDTERKVLESSRIPLAVYQFINRKVTTLVLSDGFCELFGYDDRAAACYDMDNDMYKNVHPDDSARIENTALRFAEDSDGKARYESDRG